jgi:ATP-dependent HslUV protease ATP-binding subunit HslU
MNELTPKEIVTELDKYIIGQNKAKRSVAIAMRNRWRRMQLDPKFRVEVTPKNILMIGPTGVGKTEIARRLAKLTDAPFLKVEATKYTEIGYVGKEVGSIIKDLADVAMKMLREKQIKQNQSKAEELAEERVLDALLPSRPNATEEEKDTNTRQIFRKKLREGELNNTEIEIKLKQQTPGVEILTPPGMEDMASQLEEIFGKMPSSDNYKSTKVTVKDALKIITEEENSNLVNDKEIKQELISVVENNGIVFIDEIDKICEQKTSDQNKVSREGVQRDLLPLIEGCSVKTKYGMIKTDHILFITSGAFQLSKPSDLIPELQGRLPIRVELEDLTADDFEKILTEPNASLTEQCIKMLATEGVSISFAKDGIKKIAEAAFSVNENTENIGARRLHTIMEKLIEELSFSAPENCGKSYVIDANYVSSHLDKIVANNDLSRYIL